FPPDLPAEICSFSSLGREIRGRSFQNIGHGLINPGAESKRCRVFRAEPRRTRRALRKLLDVIGEFRDRLGYLRAFLARFWIVTDRSRKSLPVKRRARAQLSHRNLAKLRRNLITLRTREGCAALMSERRQQTAARAN